MRTLIKLVPLALLGGAVFFQACGTVPVDTIPGNEFPPAGVIRGNVVYSGPPPCTQNGHVVGNAVILVFDRKNPPPPAGLANTAVNFAVVSGDALFANTPRTPGTTKICPAPDAPLVNVTSGYAIAPMAAGSYVMQSFYDFTGDFLPTFKFRNLPEATDVGGGYIDLNDPNVLVQTQEFADGGIQIVTTPKSASASYQPIFLPVDVGIPGPVSPSSLRGVPDFTMPGTGYVADNITVFIGSKLTFARPYFYPEGVSTNANVTAYGSSATRPTKAIKTAANPDGNVDFQPVLSFPQDIQILAQPGASEIGNVPAVKQYEASFPHLLIHWGVPSIEAPIAADITKPQDPFHMQLANPPAAGAAAGGNNGFFVFSYDSPDPAQFNIPEGTVPRLWPLVVLAKLEDDPTHVNDPQDGVFQGADLKKPVVIIQGITLSQDSLLNTVLGRPSVHPDSGNLTDHFTVLLRPNTLCLDPRHVDRGGTLVTPYLCGHFPPADTGPSGDTGGGPGSQCPGLGNIVDPNVTSSPQLTSLVRQDGQGLQFGCMPTGRYAVNVVYPTGQAWTTPNEIGSCALLEGTTILPKGSAPGSCSEKPRPVLYSQGTRAIVEITPSTTGACKPGGAAGPVPTACTTLVGD